MVGLCPKWVYLVLQGCITNTLGIFLCWLLSHVRFGQFWGFRSWGSFAVFFLSKLLAFWRPNFSGFFSLVAGLFVVYIWRFQRKLQSGMRNLRVLPAKPDLEDSYQFSLWYPYRCQISSSLCSLFSGILWSSHMDWLATESNVPGRLVLDF